MKYKDHFGLFKLNGEMLLPPVFTYIDYFSNDRIRVFWSTMVMKTWNQITKIPDSIPYYNPNSLEYRASKRTALCDACGSILNNLEYELIGAFINEYARAYKGITIKDDKIISKQVGVIDINGNTILDPNYDIIWLFENYSYAQVKREGVYGISNLINGNTKMFDNLKIKHLWKLDEQGRCLYSEDCVYDEEEECWTGGTRGLLNPDGVLIQAGKYKFR